MMLAVGDGFFIYDIVLIARTFRIKARWTTKAKA